MKLWKKCPLLILLIVSTVILEATGFANRNGIYREYEGKTAMTPMLGAVFCGAKEGDFPWSGQEEKAVLNESGILAANDGAGDAGPGETAMPKTPEEEVPENSAAAETSEAKTPEEETVKQADSEAMAETQTEEAKTREFTRVEEDYFDDALFIGDSRTQGMLEYGGLEDRATFYCQTSLTVYDLFKKDKPFVKEGGRKLTLTEALTQRQFGKIYLMVGINEMGTGTPESFFEEYARAVYRIQQLQPDAIVFVQAIMRVGGEKNAADPLFNNHNINVRNVEIQTLADNRTVFYIDVNEAVCDENGNLHDDWTFDQIHLKAKYYQVWKEFLLDHGIVRE